MHASLKVCMGIAEKAIRHLRKFDLWASVEPQPFSLFERFRIKQNHRHASLLKRFQVQQSVVGGNHTTVQAALTAGETHVHVVKGKVNRPLVAAIEDRHGIILTIDYVADTISLRLHRNIPRLGDGKPINFKSSHLFDALDPKSIPKACELIRETLECLL